MSAFDNLREQGEGLVDEHGEQAGQGVDKAGEFLDEKTGGEHSAQIQQGEQRAKDALDNLDGQDDDIS
jgi:hypothetical protein